MVDIVESIVSISPISVLVIVVYVLSRVRNDVEAAKQRLSSIEAILSMMMQERRDDG